MGFSRGASIVTDGLKLYLATFNTKSYPGSGSTVTDLSGNGFNATIHGSPVYNGALLFDTGDESISISINSTLVSIFNGDFTLITSSFSTDIQYPRSRHPLAIGGSPTSTDRGLQIGEGVSDSSILIEVSDGINYSSSNITHSAQSYVTYHRTFLVNRASGINIKYYVNAQYINELNSALVTGDIVDSGNGAGSIVFGDASGWRFIGDIFVIMLYNKLLSESEITQNYNVIRRQT
jgi:hypothetical protein